MQNQQLITLGIVLVLGLIGGIYLIVDPNPVPIVTGPPNPPETITTSKGEEINIDSLMTLKAEIENQQQKSTPEIVKEPEEVKPKVNTKKERRKELIKMSEEALTKTSQIDEILYEIEENNCEFKENGKKEIIERLKAYRELLNYIYRIEKNKTLIEVLNLQKNFQSNKAVLSNAQVKYIEQKFEDNGIKVE